MAATARHLACLLLLAVTSSARDQSRWSRQISSYTADISDWVPLPGPVERPAETLYQNTPIKRQAIAEPRILAEPVQFPTFPRQGGFGPEQFPSRLQFPQPSNRQLYLQSVPAVPSAPQNYLSDQGFGQAIRFGLQQPNFPLSQGFVAPQLGFDGFPQLNQRPPPPTQPIKFESFPKSLPSQQVSPQAKPFINNQASHHSLKPQGLKPQGPKTVDGYQIENASNTFTFPSTPKKKPVSLQKLKYEQPKIVEPIPTNKPKSEREEVQLLYVPVESLNRGQFNFKTSQGGNPQILNAEFFNQNIQKPQQQQPHQQIFASDFQRQVTKPIDYNFGQDYFPGFSTPLKELDQVPKFSTISSPFPTLPPNPTTAKPKKLKPHQPPLAVFLAQETKKGEKVKVGDVLLTLKNAKTVAVLDSVSPGNAPKVFIGPSSLIPPEHYAKFELPYLSNLQNSDRKLKQMPFFVAPLSYNTPDGFAKIPFPSPHVGSVIVNAQVKDISYAAPAADVIPNSYTPSYKQEQNKPTTKPTFSYYSTIAPKTNSPPGNDYQSSYYSFEPQQVSTIRPKEPEPSIVTAPPKQGSYFIQNNDQYEQNQYVKYQKPNQEKYNSQEPIRGFNIPKQSESTRGGQQHTSRPQFVKFEPEDQTNYNLNTQEPIRGSKTKSTTTPVTTTHTRLTSTKQSTQSPSTYPSQLLETHNPYSINQAFHLSTPISEDYQNYFDEGYVNSGSSSQSLSPSPKPPTSVTTKPEPIVTEKSLNQQQSSPNYLQNYSPEIHYESENAKYHVFSQNEYSTKPEVSSEVSSPGNTEYSTNIDTQAPEQQENLVPETQRTLSELEQYYQSTKAPSVYNNYGNDAVEYKEPEPETTSTTTTTTTTTTRRTPLRTRGRPRYTTTPRTESSETTKTVATRRPLRERRPLPTRSRYEPNKITTERPTRKPVQQESAEATTKSTTARGRTRARGQYRPAESDDTSPYEKKGKKEADLAYQRDVLHQNYPVTLQERMSTVDIEAITEPVSKISSAKNQEPVTETYDTEQAYSNEQAYSQLTGNTQKESDSPYDVPQNTPEFQTETPYASRVPSTKSEEYVYHSRSSAAPVQSVSNSESYEKDEASFYSKSTPPIRQPEIISIATEPLNPATEQPRYSVNYSRDEEEEIITTRPDLEITKIDSSVQSGSSEGENIEEIEHQTTPSYKVRVRPGNRQYNQVTTEAPNTQTSKTTKTDRRRPVQAVTYRPSFSQRRTTMRIEEIEADLKTKQIHARPEQDYRHPVYKPEPTTESPVTTQSTEPTKRGQFRRRRPSYSTTSTEAAVTKKGSYEIKSRFKGRRPTTEKATTEKPEVKTDAPSTSRTIPYSRYTRPRLSERFNKKRVENEESEDQESNYSINRPRYAEAEESEQWSSKFSADSFKPYNPNDIQDEIKLATTERRSDQISELDIITARNDYEDILVSVTPATNRNNKKIPEIPPTLEALVEQSKVTESGDQMSTFETMLEEVMKSLEEKDENEYTTNVMKHKGGEIGEIPPEKIISNEDNNVKSTTAVGSEVTTVEPSAIDDTSSSGNEEEKDRKGRRRGFWKKVNVRPIGTESIEVAESQYYTSSVNRLQDTKPSKLHDKTEKLGKAKVTTYKPSFQFIEEIFDDKEVSNIPLIEDIPKINTKKITDSHKKEATMTTVAPQDVTDAKIDKDISTEKLGVNPGELDLGTGSPDSTIVDMFYSPTTTESGEHVSVDRNDGFSLMDYLFGVTSSDSESDYPNDRYGSKIEENKSFEVTESSQVEIKTEVTKPQLVTTETSFIPDEITAVSNVDETTEISQLAIIADAKNWNVTEAPKFEEKAGEAGTEKELDLKAVETASVSSFMDPTNIVSTSMSTEISHETEICFRGKCFKNIKDIL